MPVITCKVRSNCDPAGAIGRSTSDMPAGTVSLAGWFTQTCTASGGSPSRRSSRWMRSNGVPAWRTDSLTSVSTRRVISRNDGASPASSTMGRRLMNTPTRSAICGRSRPAADMPSSTLPSSLLGRRYSARAATRTANGVADSARHSWRTDADVASSSSVPTVAPAIAC